MPGPSPLRILDDLPDAVLVVDHDGVAAFANARAREWFGIDVVGQQVGVPLSDDAHIHVTSRDGIRIGEMRVADAPEWGPRHQAMVIRDVTASDAMKRDLEQTVADLRGLVQLLTVMPTPVARLDPAGSVLWRNDAFTRSFGEVASLQQSIPLQGHDLKIRQLLESTTSEESTSLVLEPLSVEALPILARSVLLRHDDRLPSGDCVGDEIGVVLDSYSGHDDVLAEYLELVYLDADLRIPNLSGLEATVRPHWEDPALAHVVVTVLDWSQSNADGDRTPQQEPDRIRWLLAHVETARTQLLLDPAVLAASTGRVATHGFAIAISGPTHGAADLMLAAARLARAIEEIGEASVLSIGMVSAGALPPSIPELVEEATVAAEIAHRDGVFSRLFTEGDAQTLARARLLRTRLRAAVEDSAFTCVYQPRIDLATGQMCGAEVLARWHDDVLGDVSPEVFVPVLKKLGLVSLLTRMVLSRSFAQLAQWREEGLPTVKLSINIVSGDLSSGWLLPTLAAMMDSNCRLELELAEGDSFPYRIGDDERRSFADLGVELSLDDFGTGFSTFAYLVSLPISCIKVDKMFADHLLEPEYRDTSIALYRSIVALARELNITVCAEGVETEAQLRDVERIGVHEVQGYYFSRPLTADALADGYLR